MSLTTKFGQQVKAPGLEFRFNTQNARIRDGMQSGELTRSEKQAVRFQRNSIGNHLAHAKADDGVLDRQERRALHKRANNASDLIYRLKHNDFTT